MIEKALTEATAMGLTGKDVLFLIYGLVISVYLGFVWLNVKEIKEDLKDTKSLLQRIKGDINEINHKQP